MTQSSPTRRRFSALAATALVASLAFTGALPAMADHLVIVGDDLVVVEGEDPADTTTFTVALAGLPAEAVTIDVASNDESEVTVGPAQLEFTTDNWATPQEVTVTSVDDDIDDGDLDVIIDLTIALVSHGTVTITNQDNDSAGIVVTAPDGGLETTEGGGDDTFSIRLTSEPTHDVTVGVSSSDLGEATVSTGSVVLTAANWETGVEVTVSGVNDGGVDGDIGYTVVLAESVSDDTNYAGKDPADIAGTNLDNDVAPPPADNDPVEEDGNTFNDTGTLDTETVAAIETLVALEITQGTSASLFSPSQVVSRWQMALFLTRQLAAHGVTLPTPTDQGFIDIADLDAETWNAISQLAALDVTTGTGTGTYSPDAGVTRAQMALFMTRVLDAAGVDLPTTFSGEFTDIGDLSPAAQLAIRQLAALGVVFGVGDDTFDPTAEIPRWQMALFIVRTLEAAGVATS